MASSIIKSESQSLYPEAFYDVAPVPSLASSPTTLPIGHYILAVPLCSSGTHLPQGLCTYSSLCLKCSSPNARMTHVLPRSWLKCHLLHDAFPDHSIYHFNCLPASSPARLRSCPCLFLFPPSTSHHPTHCTDLSWVLSRPSTSVQWSQWNRNTHLFCGGYYVQMWLMLL